MATWWTSALDLRSTFHFSNGSAPTLRQTRQNPFDQREPAYDQRNNYELSQVGNRTNYNSAPVDDMTAFYNEVRATLAFRTEYLVSCRFFSILSRDCRLHRYKMKSETTTAMLTKFHGYIHNCFKMSNQAIAGVTRISRILSRKRAR